MSRPIAQVREAPDHNGGPVETPAGSVVRELLVEDPEQRIGPADAGETESGDSTPEVRKGHLSAVRGRIRDWGWQRAIFWQIMHTLKEYFGITLSYVRVGADRTDLRDPNPPEMPPGYDVFVATKEDFEPFVGKVEFLDREFVDNAFANGDEASIALYDGELVGYSFATRVKARVTSQLELHVPKNFRYGYKAWTHEDHRRRNVSRMMSHVRIFNNPMRRWEERGIWIVFVHNYPSLLHSYRHPSERSIRMGYVGWITLFGRQIPFNTRKAKWIGLELRRQGDERVRQYL